MKIIIPLAGKGTRMRPHTHTRAKPLFFIAGKPILGHILDSIKNNKVEEIIFITGHLGKQVEEFVTNNYTFKARFIEQTELKGQAHAVLLAKDFVKEDVLVWFVDTISDADISKLDTIIEDGVIFVKEVKDPRRFGVVVIDDQGIVKELIEKPEEPVSNLVNIGMYYAKDASLLFSSIEELIAQNRQTQGEFYLVDALQMMIRKGTRFKAEVVSVWEDCGKPETTLETNKYFLQKGNTQVTETKNSVIILPVYIEKGAVVENSIIGPNVSIAGKAHISHSIIKNTIVGEGATVEKAHVHNSIIGDHATLKGTLRSYNVGDDSQVEH
ncbi:MAG: sugar phosphate nucleotidyltransferase [Nanoarchaeota archaeon]